MIFMILKLTHIQGTFYKLHINKFLRSIGVDIPINYYQTFQQFKSFYQEEKKKLKQYFASQKNEKFHASADSISIRGSQFLNIFLHDQNKKVFHLSLVEEKERASTKYLKKLFERVLKDHNLSLKNISYLTTDSANNMISLAAKCGLRHQRCLVHLIHTITLKILFDRKTLPTRFVRENQNDESQNKLSISESGDSESFQSQGEQFENLTEEEKVKEFQSDEDSCSSCDQANSMFEIINKIRRTVKKLRKSNVFFLRFKKICKNYGKYPIRVPIDCKTRWYSTKVMLQRFIEYSKMIYEASEVKQDEQEFERQIESVKELLKVLTILSDLQLKLQAKQCNIINAERLMDSCLLLLAQKKSIFADKTSSILLSYYQKYRNKFEMFLGLILQKKSDYYKYFEDCKFQKVTVEGLQTFLHLREPINQNQGEAFEIQNISQLNSLEEIYNAKYGDFEKGPSIDEAFHSFLNGEQKSTELKQILKQILSIPVHTGEIERNFSEVGRAFNKCNAMLSAKTLQMIMFVRWSLRQNQTMI